MNDSNNILLIKNNYFILKNNFCDKFFIAVYFVSDNLCRIKARRIDHNEWGQDLKIVLHDINFIENNNYENISIGSSDKSVKIMEVYTKITLEPILISNIDKIPQTIISYYNEPINSDIYTYNISLGIIDLNPFFKYKIFNEKDIRKYISQKYINKLDEKILEAFDLIYEEDLKGLFFKYIYLYHDGGCYIPINVVLKNSIYKIIYDEYFEYSEYLENNNIIITDKYNKEFLICSPRNQIIQTYIYKLRDSILNNESFSNDILLNNNLIIKNKIISEYEENKIIKNDLHSTIYKSLFYKSNKIEDENFKFYFLPSEFKDTFIIYKTYSFDLNSIYIIKRTDDSCGWGQNLNIKAINILTNKIHYINIGISKSNEKIFII